MSMLEIKNISFSYNDTSVLNNINFSVEKGKHISIIGESGCGKSTLLKIIYGLLHVDEGEVYYNNKKLLGPNFYLVPGEEFMKYQAQDFDLMPFITVEENVGKYLSNFYKKEKKRRIQELLKLVEMTEYAHVKPRFLSGGQQQRIALARVLAKEPEIILLDEPFSNIDNFKKNNLRRNLFSYFKEKGITCIVATHDNADTLSYADEVIVLRDGKIVAKNTPESLYKNPPNKYTAALFDVVNELPAYLLMPFEDKERKVLVYPHELSVSDQSNFKVKIINNYFKGNSVLIEAQRENATVFFEHNEKLQSGDEVYLISKNKFLKDRLS